MSGDNLIGAIRADVESFRHHNGKRIESALCAAAGLAMLRDTLEHGDWLPALERIGLEPRTAQRWIAAAGTGFECDTVSYLGLSRTAKIGTALDRDWPDWREARSFVECEARAAGSLSGIEVRAIVPSWRERWELECKTREIRADIAKKERKLARIRADVEANLPHAAILATHYGIAVPK